MRDVKYYLFVVLLAFVFCGSSIAQSGEERRADYKIAEQNYEDGIYIYNKILEKAKDETALRVHHKLATLYYTIRQYPKSMEQYDAILKTNKLDSLNVDDACNILTMLNRAERKDDASKWAEVFAKNDAMMNSQKFRNLERSIVGLDVPVSDDTLNYAITSAPFNTLFSEFWTGQFNKEYLIFVRSDAGAEGSAKTLFQGSRFYLFNKKTQQAQVYDKFPLVFQAGPASFYSDNKSMIYTDNNMKSGIGHSRVSTVGKRNLQLIYAKYNSNKNMWKSVKSIFKSNDPNISYCHPCLTNHDQTLFFSSNMPGGFGGADIYKSDWDSATQEWGTPVNLGKVVNTDGDELYPMVRDSILYFTSNGHTGLGGYDIYGANLNGKDEVVGDHVIYLPAPINTRFNDYSLFLNTDKKTGYFTSDRTGGKGIDDIYAFVATPKKKPVVVLPKVDSTVIDTVAIIDAITKVEELANVYFDFDKSNIRPQEKMQELLSLMQSPEYANTSFLLLGSADIRGSKAYNVKLSAKRAETVKAWLVKHGIDANHLLTQARGAIPLSDAQLRKDAGLPELAPLTDKQQIRKVYQEARRVIVKTIVPTKK